MFNPLTPESAHRRSCGTNSFVTTCDIIVLDGTRQLCVGGQDLSNRTQMSPIQ